MPNVLEKTDLRFTYILRMLVYLSICNTDLFICQLNFTISKVNRNFFGTFLSRETTAHIANKNTEGSCFSIAVILEKNRMSTLEHFLYIMIALATYKSTFWWIV